MTNELIRLVEHHAKRAIPSFARLSDKVAAQGPLEPGWIYLALLGLGDSYSYLNDPEKLVNFTKVINESVDAWREGRVEVIPERRKKDDHVCQACDNLKENRCILERRRFLFR